MGDAAANPLGLNGFELVEFTSPDPDAMAFRVADPQGAMAWALDHGAKPTEEDDTVIQGIGGSHLYVVADGEDLYADWAEFPGWREAEARNNVGLDLLDHLTHNVRRGQMRVWSEFYRMLFNFEEQKYFDIKGKATGLFSQAMIAPDLPSGETGGFIEDGDEVLLRATARADGFVPIGLGECRAVVMEAK